jgi:hypothetical protein
MSLILLAITKRFHIAAPAKALRDKLSFVSAKPCMQRVELHHRLSRSDESVSALAPKGFEKHVRVKSK